MVKTRTAYIANLSTEDLGSAVDARLPSRFHSLFNYVVSNAHAKRICPVEVRIVLS